MKDAVAFLICRVEDIRIMDTHNIFTCTIEDAWLGDGEPLLYNEYQINLKGAVMSAFAEFKESGKSPSGVAPEKAIVKKINIEEKWVCTVCGYVYNEETPFEELPPDWTCPLCGADKSLIEKQ